MIQYRPKLWAINNKHTHKKCVHFLLQFRLNSQFSDNKKNPKKSYSDWLSSSKCLLIQNQQLETKVIKLTFSKTKPFNSNVRFPICGHKKKCILKSLQAVEKANSSQITFNARWQPTITFSVEKKNRLEQFFFHEICNMLFLCHGILVEYVCLKKLL